MQQGVFWWIPIGNKATFIPESSSYSCLAALIFLLICNQYVLPVLRLLRPNGSAVATVERFCGSYGRGQGARAEARDQELGRGDQGRDSSATPAGRHVPQCCLQRLQFSGASGSGRDKKSWQVEWLLRFGHAAEIAVASSSIAVVGRRCAVVRSATIPGAEPFCQEA